MTGETTEQRNKSCEERIGDQLASTMKSITDLLSREASDDDEVREEAIEEWSNDVLSVEVKKTVRVLMSTGGPADWFECEIDDENAITAITYVFEDWYDHAERRLQPGTDEYTAAERYCDYFIEALDLPA